MSDSGKKIKSKKTKEPKTIKQETVPFTRGCDLEDLGKLWMHLMKLKKKNC